MARNRKSQSAGLIVGAALKAFLICSFIVVCCVGYVWQKKQISDLSQQIRAQENALAAARDQNDKMKKQLASLLSPPSLEARVRELKLGLVLPDPAKIWRLPEPIAETAATGRPHSQQYAAGNSGDGLP